jgi:hypothetical protein
LTVAEGEIRTLLPTTSWSAWPPIAVKASPSARFRSPPTPSVNTPDPRASITLLGDYELIEEVASGGMGVVWRARQRSLNRIVALKTIRAAHLARPEDVVRFRTEAAAAGLRHPGIVTVHDIGAEEGQHCFTMELVEGPSLATRLRDGSLAPERAGLMLRDIARAVQHAHEHGVLHRDLKPPVWLVWSSADDRIAAVGDDGEVAVLDREPFRVKARFKLPQPLLSEWKVAGFSPNGRWLICSLENGETVAWDWAAGRASFTWAAESRTLMDAAISPSGLMAATVHEGGPVTLWSLEAGRPPCEVVRLAVESQWPRALAFSPDNGRLAVGSESGAVTILNVATPLPVATLRANDLPVYRIWFHAPQDTLVTSSPGAMGLWRAGGG